MNTDKITEHMEVKSADGQHVGIVDHMDGKDKIKLAKSDKAAGGMHHYIPVDWIDHIDAHVHLSKTAADVKAQWQS